MAINMPIQGTAADIAEDRDDPRSPSGSRAEGFRARLLLQVHDELLLEVPRDEVDRLIPVLRETMEGALPLDVPLTVDVKVGTDWESMTPVSRRDAILAEADEAPVDGAVAGLAGATRPPSSAPMPELPEVETVARDLRGLVVGARISGVRVSWLKTLRSQDPAAFARGRGRADDRRHVAAGEARRARPRRRLGAITIHLKMTGQLFVVRAGAAGGSVRPARARVRGRARAAVPRHPQVRAGRRRAARSGDRRPRAASSAARKGFKGFGPEPLDAAFTARGLPAAAPRRGKGRLKPLLLDQAFVAGVGNIYADEALWAARLHPLRSAASLRPGRRGPALPRAAPDPRRGGRAARLVDRRLHGARGRRLDAGAPARLPARRRAVRALRPAGPADRRSAARSTHFCSWCQRLPAGEQAGRGGDPAGDGAAAGTRRADAAAGAAEAASRDPPRAALDRDRRRGRLARDADRLDAARGAGLARRADARGQRRPGELRPRAAATRQRRDAARRRAA